MKRLLWLLVPLMLISGSAFGYDQGMADGYAKFFAAFSGKDTPKALHMIGTADFVKAIKTGEKLFLLDVRTPAETAIYGLNYPDTAVIPMDEVFKPDNLARIPLDRKVVVVCKGGHRAMAIATALRHVGFDNVFTLKLGLEDLAAYLNPKSAY